MKAAQINEYGGPESVKITETDQPPVADDQLLVEVRAAAVNPFDVKVSQGHARQMAELKFPATLGGDLSGVVAAVGSAVSGFEVGDEVYGLAGALSGHGSFAQFAPVAATSAGRKPSGLNFLEAAALPLAGVSAYQSLVETLQLKAGQKILIHGGAGGIGSLAIQLAKHLGAHVATTAAADDEAFVKELGAEVFIDYKGQKFQDVVKDYDAVFDTVGGDTLANSYSVLKPGGALTTMAGQPDEALASKYQVTATGQFTRLNPERLAGVTKLVEDGDLKPVIDKTFPFEQTAEAMAYLAQGGHRGKVLINVSA